MTTFWIIAAGLTLLAIAFVLFPLFFGKSREQEDIDRNKLNIEVIRQQIAELDADLAAGTLEQAQYDKAREDLERELLADVSDDDPTRHASSGGQWAFVVAALAVPAIAFPLYGLLGGYQQVSEAPAASAARADGQRKLPPLDKMIGALEAKLKQDPDNLQGWQLLGRSYVALQRPKDAVKAYRKALELAPEDPDTLLALADVLAALNDDRFAGEPARLVQKAIEKSPGHPNALWMMGVVEFQRGGFRKSVAYWEKLLEMLPPASKDIDDLNSAIKEARSRAGMPPREELPSITGGAVAGGGEGIEVSVDIDPALKAQAAPDDTVFIFAKAASGPPMPLAVVRKKVSELPAKVRLDDSMAMMPQLKLSAFPQVKIGARISKSGRPTASDGDLEGLVGPIPTQSGKPVTLVIDHIHGGSPAQNAPPVAQDTAPAAAAKPAQTPTAGGPPGVTLRIDIDPALKGRYSPDDILFIYAKAASGPPMPLAAARKRARDLPLTIHLDDSMAMMPQMRLSRFPKVIVGARISKTGQPMPAPGDLEGTAGPVASQGGGLVRITIDRAR